MGQVTEMPNRKKPFVPDTEGLAAVNSIAHGQPLSTLEDVLSEQHFTLLVSRWLEDILTTNEKERILSTVPTPDLEMGLTLALANQHLERVTELGQQLSGNFKFEK